MYIIGIGGGTASGKSTLVHNCVQAFEPNEIVVISQDNYYKTTHHLNFEEREKINFDHPDAIDFELLSRQVKELKNGKSINQPIYDFSTHNRTQKVIQINPPKVLIIEGILVFSKKELRNLFNLKIYVDTADKVRLKRRLKRDIEERGRTEKEVLERYKQTTLPMHKAFVKRYKTKADVLINNNDYSTAALEILTSFLKQKIKE
jgi:uridine kinase